MSTGQTLSEGDLHEMVLRLAHEIRNPLSTIQSAVQLLEHLHQPLGETAEFYESIYVEVSRIDQVVRDIQRFVRLDSQVKTRIPVGDAVQSGVEVAASGHQTTRISVTEGPEVSVLMDQVHFEDAIAELLDNALRFSPSDSTVVVSWRLVDGGSVAIDVDDEGQGIADQDRDTIMRPFYSSSTQGTGLGLNIVSRACRLAGGRLEWSPRQPLGTRFTMLLPVVGASG